MQYFMISQDKEISNSIEITGLDFNIYYDGAARKEFDKAPNMIVTYFQNSQEIEKPDVIFSPAFLVSDRVKKLLKVYEPKMRFKGIRCYSKDVKDPEALLYWWPYLPKTKCLSNKTQKEPTGLVKKLVVSADKIKEKPIVMVGDTIETIVLVSLELAESFLRRNIWGMEYTPVEVEGVRHGKL